MIQMADIIEEQRKATDEKHRINNVFDVYKKARYIAQRVQQQINDTTAQTFNKGTMKRLRERVSNIQTRFCDGETIPKAEIDELLDDYSKISMVATNAAGSANGMPLPKGSVENTVKFANEAYALVQHIRDDLDDNECFILKDGNYTATHTGKLKISGKL